MLKAFASVVIHVIGPIMTHNMHLFLFIALLNYFLYIPKLAVTDENFKYLAYKIWALLVFGLNALVA